MPFYTLLIPIVVTPERMKISEIRPQKGKAGDSIQIFGIKFGDQKDTVWFEDAVKNMLKGDEIQGWKDNRIDLKVPTDLLAGKYYIRVAKGELLTPKKKFVVT